MRMRLCKCNTNSSHNDVSDKNEEFVIFSKNSES